MNILIFLIISFSISGLIIYFLSKKIQRNLSHSLPKLYCSCNKNSYADARDVYETLNRANIKINFLGENNV